MALSPPQIAIRRTAPGLILLRAAAQPLEGNDPAALRAAAFFRKSERASLAQLAVMGEAPPGEGHPRDITLLDGALLAPSALQTLLEGLWRLPGRPLLRLELEAERLPARGLTLAEARGWRGGALQVHLLFAAPHLPRGLAPALRLLADAGIPLAAEIFLERGVTDSPQALREFLPQLLRHRVRPYYLIDGAWLPPERRVRGASALKLVQGLRGWISGLAVPQLVREGLDGVRTPLVPSHLLELDEHGATVVDYRGERRRYPHLRPENE